MQYTLSTSLKSKYNNSIENYKHRHISCIGSENSMTKTTNQIEVFRSVIIAMNN